MPHDPESPLMPHGGYENLRSYAVAEAVYDATIVFCDRFIGKKQPHPRPNGSSCS
ncbi:hypothetical protein [Prosthecobacter sp.]